MLALTHHFIIQVAAQRVGINYWFRDYAVLGDDVVIGNSSVAAAYTNLARELGVEINLSKSLESSIGVAEFAKRLMTKDFDYSPVSPKLIHQLVGQVRVLPMVLRDMVERGLSVKPFELFAVKGKLARFKVPSNLLWEIVGPLGFIGGAGLSPFLGDRSLSSQELHKFLSVVDKYLNKERVARRFSYLEKSHTLLTNLIVKIKSDSFDIFSPKRDVAKVTSLGLVEMLKGQ